MPSLFNKNHLVKIGVQFKTKMSQSALHIMWCFASPLECQNWETLHNQDVIGVLQHILGYGRASESMQDMWFSYQPQIPQWTGNMRWQPYSGTTHFTHTIIYSWVRFYLLRALWSMEPLFIFKFYQPNKFQQQIPYFLSIFSHRITEC